MTFPVTIRYRATLARSSRTAPGDHKESEIVSESYVHGYHARENERLQDQAGTLVDLLHSDTAYPRESTVLEVGCGVGFPE